ncbi:anti-sigma factor family protein [Lacipirellula sp.]|uniref:anti-sigma factor family protein n=1 Tax=Lacipirellula sp. TaxID=2691419 RepID=UPI003D0B775D
MPPTPNDNLQRLEEIVAYLDGELSPEESARVEQRLASDESYRRQLQGIEQAWTALDALPQEYVDDRFSRTTMELAVKAAATEVLERTMALPVVQRRRRLSSILAAVAAAALAFLVFRLAWQSADRALLADLPLVDNVDVYTQFDSPGFLRSLRNEFGGDFHEFGCAAGKAPERTERFQTVSLTNGRDDWLAKLDDEERTQLRAKFNRFHQLPVEEQQRIRKLHNEIATADDAAQLQQAMLVYADWVGGLPPARQYELRTMQPSERVRTIDRWLDEMRDDALLTLTDEELHRFVRKIREPLDQLQREATREALESNDGRGRGRMQLNQIPNAMFRRVAIGMGKPGDFQDAALEALPERTHEAFKSLSPQHKVERIMTWLRQSESLQGEVSQEALESFFADEKNLDAETRAKLLSLPPGEMEQALRRLYRSQPGRGFGKPWAWDGPKQEGRRGPGGPGGPEGRDGRGGFGHGAPMGPSGGPGGPGGRGGHWEGGPGRPEGGPGGPPPHERMGPGDRGGRGPFPGAGPEFEGEHHGPHEFGPPPGDEPEPPGPDDGDDEER